MKRILFAMTHTIEAKEGGASYSMDTVVKELSKRHECIPFICPKRIKPYGLYPTSRQRAKMNAEYGEHFLKGIIKESTPDIIHTSGFGSCLLGAYAKRKFAIPWIHHSRSLSDETFLNTLEDADHMILIGEWMKYTKLGKLPIPKTVIYNPLPFTLSPSFSLDGREGIVMVGDKSGRKGIEVGIKAWRKLRNHPPLDIFGDTRQNWDHNGLNHHGKVPQRDLLKRMKKARFTLFPKRFKGWFDRTLLESQMVGTVALQSCGRHIHDPPVANTIRFPPTVSSLRNALESALSMNQDEYMRMSEQAYGWVRQNCTVEKSAMEIERIYDSLA